MFKRFLRTILSTLMLVSMASAALPAATAGAEGTPTGQTFFITTTAELVTDITSTVGSTSWNALDLTIGTDIPAEGTVDYLAGDWTVFIPLTSQFTGSLTLSIGKVEMGVWTYYGTRTFSYDTPVNVISSSIPVDAFSVGTGGYLLLHVTSMSNPMYFTAGGSNSFIAAPYGSNIFPSGVPQGGDPGGYPPDDPAWPSTPTIDDPDDDANGVPEVTGLDYLADDTNLYVRFIAGADFTFDNQSIAVAFDIDNNAATGDQSGMFGPVGTDYKLMCGFNEGTYMGTNFQKYGSPSGIPGAFFTDMKWDPRYFYYTIPLSILGADSAQFLDGVYLDAVIGGPGVTGPVQIDQITGDTSAGGGGGGLPDLVINQVLAEWINPDAPNGLYIVNFTLLNAGEGDADYSQVELLIDGTSQGTITTDPLAAGASRTGWFTNSTEGYLLSGEDTIVVIADAGYEITEENENNNSRQITWPPPADTFTLTLAVNPPGSGSTDPAVGQHTYDAGTVVDITATPGNGYDFVSWTGDVASPTSLQTTVTMDGDKTVAANFQQEQLPHGTAWTVLVYMAADNNLEPDMLKDLNEMEFAGSSDNVTILALFDGYGAANTNAYLVGLDADGVDTELVSSLWTPSGGWSWAGTGEANMGDPATLQEFIEKSVAEFPAVHYALIFSNHGNGWRSAEAEPASLLKGICWDETSADDYLTIPEVSGVLATVTTGDTPAVPGGFGVIGFDACLMQMTEVAYELKDYGWFMVGSEESEWGAGWPYDTIFGEFVPANQTEIVTCRDFSNSIVANYGDYYTTVANDTYHTLSAVELKPTMSGGMNAVAAAIDNLVQTIMAAGDYAAVEHASWVVEYFADDTYVDLLDFADKVRNYSSVPAVDARVNELKQVLVGGETFPPYPVIISNVHGSDHPAAYGLSIYQPYPPDFTEPEPGYAALAFAEDTLWDEFVSWFLSGGDTTHTWTEIIPDASGDQMGDADAPDIAGIDVDNTVPESKSFRVRMNNILYDWYNEYGLTLFDMDSDPATGNPDGAEFAVMTTNPWNLDGTECASDAWEYDDDYGSATPISVDGESQSHNAHMYGDVDWYSFTAEAGEQYVIETFNLGVNSDTVLDLYEGDGSTLITSNDDNGYDGTTASRIEWTATTGGTYYIMAYQYYPDDFGVLNTYDIRVTSGETASRLSRVSDTTRVPAEWVSILQKWDAVSHTWAYVRQLPLYGGDSDYWFTVHDSDFAEYPDATPLIRQEAGYCDEQYDAADDFYYWTTVPTDYAPDLVTPEEPEWTELVADAAGDSPAGLDIYGVDYFKHLNTLKSEFVDGKLGFRIRGDIDFTDFYAMTMLDTDRDPATGESGESYNNDIGVDYSLDVYPDGYGGLVGEIWKWELGIRREWTTPVAEFPVFTGETDGGQPYFWFMINLSMIEELDGFMDVVQSLDLYEVGIDLAPDTGHASIAPRTLPDAIEDGLAWLAAQQNTDGSWGDTTSNHRLGETALAVYKLEEHAEDLGLSPFSDDYMYKQAVVDGLAFILGYGTVVDITNPQPNQAPGYVDNAPVGQGISFDNDPGLHHSYETYYTAISAMAIAASMNMTAVYSNSLSPLDGMTYQAILENVVDFLAWGQSDYDWARGGWNYERMDDNDVYIRSDESNTGWVTLALAYAEELGIMTPGWVRSELERWVTYIQEPSTGEGTGGGAYYTSSDDPNGVNALRTGNLLQQFAFLGDTDSDYRVQLSLDYLARVWDDWTTGDYDEGWYYDGAPSFYHATYTIMKGMEAFGLAELPGPINWYEDFKDALLDEQNTDGSWPVSNFDQGDRILSTVWALLTLERDIPVTREGPDLVIQGAFVTPLDEQAGTYEISYTALNKGNVTAPSGVVVTITINDVPQQIGEKGIIPVEMTPGLPGSFTWGNIGPFTRDPQRDFDTIIITIDPANAVAELNEDNNPYREDYPSKPDLIIKDKWEEWVDVDDPSQGFTVHFTVRNIGNGAILPTVGEPVDVLIAVALDGQYQQETIVLPVALEPGETWTGQFATTYYLPQDGNVDITVTADSTDVVMEWDETNNSKINTLDINQQQPGDAYEPDNVSADAKWIIVNGPGQERNFHEAGDVDYAKFEATAGTTYTIETYNLGEYTDTYLNIFDTDGTTSLVYDDDSGEGWASLLTWECSVTGVYFIYVTAFGNGGETGYEYSLKVTTDGSDTVAPTVTEHLPNVQFAPVTTDIVVTFSEPMNQAETETAFGIDPAVTGTFEWPSPDQLRFVPAANLPYETFYTVTIGASAADLAGNTLAGNQQDSSFVFTFTTDQEALPPAVQMIIPASFATDVAVTTTVEITFTEPMNQASVEGAFTLYPHGGSAVAGSFSWNGDAIMTFTPDAALAYNTIYWVNITTAAESLAGVPFESLYSNSFSTGAEEQPQVAVIRGITYNARGEVLPGVTVTIGSESVVSDGSGAYEITVTEKGLKSVVATALGYRSLTAEIDITAVPGEYTLDFIGDSGLIPNAPNLSFVLACINKWKVDPGDGTGLGMEKVLEVINLWKNPVD